MFHRQRCRRSIKLSSVDVQSSWPVAHWPLDRWYSVRLICRGNPIIPATPIPCLLHHAHVLVTQAFSSCPPPLDPPFLRLTAQAPFSNAPDQACIVLLAPYNICGFVGTWRTSPEAEFFDEIQTKVLRVLLLAIHSHLHRFLFLQLTQPLTVSRGQLLYTVKRKEENLKENHSPFPTVSEML